MNLIKTIDYKGDLKGFVLRVKGPHNQDEPCRGNLHNHHDKRARCTPVELSTRDDHKIWHTLLLVDSPNPKILHHYSYMYTLKISRYHF